MKKLVSLLLIMALSAGFTGCGKNAQTDPDSGASREDNMSGINADVSMAETEGGTEYRFEGYFTTVIPEGIFAEDKSINSDAALFAFYDNDRTYLDVTFYEKETSDAEVAAEAKDAASKGNASEAEAIQINNITFYGLNMPDYGMTRYMGCVNGYNVTISVYVDGNDNVVQSFIANTVFTVQ